MRGKLSNDQLPPNSLPAGGFFAQLDKVETIQDYSPQQECVRLFGISSNDFENESFLDESGCQTYVIDIEAIVFWKAIQLSFRWGDSFIKHGDFLSDLGRLWIHVDFEPTLRSTSSYAYVAFTESGPQYINVRAINVLNKKIRLPALDEAQPIAMNNARAVASLSTFHVGQGMCSVYTYADQQFLIDAGAGKPVTRQNYQRNYHSDGSIFRNDLRSTLTERNLTAIISHLDSDHWRLLEWDAAICNQVATIFFPIGTSFLALRSSAIVKKVKALDSCTVRFDSANYLALSRTKPSYSDQNGEGIVVVAACGGLEALLPGDYVYARMHSDHDMDLRVLASQYYAAVVVPHHGDLESARNVPLPYTWGMLHKPIAFFSAGTHARYRHPRPASLAAHAALGFDVVQNPACPDIIEKRLL
ncbi:hypothetical protein D3C85_672170 [compost metagenome]